MEARTIDTTHSFFQGLLDALGERGRVEISPERDGLYVNLVGNFRRISEQDAQLRGDLGRIARLHLRARLRRAVPVVVDFNGRRAAHRKSLVEQALTMAERAVAEHRKVRLAPMTAEDRLVVHLALAEFPGVHTYSVGKGSQRRVVIEPEG
ncbi:MAG: R3H domain-containing nucleic acid-binding protein [Candidatus Bipolaricaulaceae bacterium]